MWLFTRHGFYSVVCARKGDGRHGRPVDHLKVMVRARLRQHLVRLIERFPEVLRQGEIREFAGTDYAYRIFVSKSDWSKVLLALNEELDYDNFKSEAARYQGSEGTDYEHALHDVWSVMYQLQDAKAAR